MFQVTSNIYFEIPQEITDETPMGSFTAASSAPKKPKHGSTLKVKNVRILAVDDTKMNLMVLERFLKTTGAALDIAESGSKCLEYVEKNIYDIILLDHFMPDMDGIETLKRIKAMTDSPNAQKPVIALTANAISSARETYINAGFTDYLTKPINAYALDDMIVRYLPKDKIESI